jgi:hypothetical protein
VTRQLRESKRTGHQFIFRLKTMMNQLGNWIWFMSLATDCAKRERQTWNQKGGRTSSWPPQHHHHRHDGHILCITQPERDRESEKVPFWVVVCSFSLGGEKKKSERENKKTIE